ncbi:hypothetical protein [Pseudotamlana carrageenivorans]|uniref:hypothetical protein n=1 Tax=Pseudotamlana carrageenivorans TaxID=2069432 RepID=UPI00131517D9|nr:hypothetical protein [Tamlana carrageenivorans]
MELKALTAHPKGLFFPNSAILKQQKYMANIFEIYKIAHEFKNRLGQKRLLYS